MYTVRKKLQAINRSPYVVYTRLNLIGRYSSSILTTRSAFCLYVIGSSR